MKELSLDIPTIYLLEKEQAFKALKICKLQINFKSIAVHIKS